MCLFNFLRAVISRALFILVSLIGVWRVAYEMRDPNYWFLTFLFMPLIVEMILTLRSRSGKDYKWFSPPIFLFLISIIPSIWILEIHYLENQGSEADCKNINLQEYLDNNWIKAQSLNGTSENRTNQNIMEIACSRDWILTLHQILLILLIVGKWLLPLGSGVTRDELSQLLLIFVGTAADILEFTTETLSDIKDKDKETTAVLTYIILAVWTWSMLQFPLHVSVVNSRSDGEDEDGAGDQSLCATYSRDLWSIAEALFIQDGPFLVVRLVVMAHYRIVHQMLVFFALKNFLVVILNLYRLAVICQDFRPSRGSAVPNI